MNKDGNHSDQDGDAGDTQAQPNTAVASSDSGSPSDEKLKEAFRELHARDAHSSEGAGGSTEDSLGTKEDTGSSSEDTGSSTQETDGDLLEAERNALHRWNWSDEYIESLPPEYVKKRAQKALKSQAVTDKALSDKAALEKQNQELEAKLEQVLKDKGLVADDPDDGAQSAGLDKDIEEVLKNLESEEDLKPAAELMRRLASSNNALEQRINELKGTVDQSRQDANKAQDDIAFTNARVRLSGDMPEIRSDEVHSRIIEQAYKLAESDVYVGETEGISEIYEDAARMVIKQVRADKANSQSQSYMNSQPSPGGGKTDGAAGATSAMSPEEAQKMTFKLLKEGKTAEEVKSILRGARIT